MTSFMEFMITGTTEEFELVEHLWLNHSPLGVARALNGIAPQ